MANLLQGTNAQPTLKMNLAKPIPSGKPPPTTGQIWPRGNKTQ